MGSATVGCWIIGHCGHTGICLGLYFKRRIVSVASVGKPSEPVNEAPTCHLGREVPDKVLGTNILAGAVIAMHNATVDQF